MSHRPEAKAVNLRFFETPGGELPNGVAKRYDVFDGEGADWLYRCDFARSNRSGACRLSSASGGAVSLMPERKLLNKRWLIGGDEDDRLGEIRADGGWIGCDGAGGERVRLGDPRSLPAKMLDGLGDFPDSYVYSTAGGVTGSISREVRPGREPGGGMFGKLKSLVVPRDWVARFAQAPDAADVLVIVCATLLLLDITVPMDRSR